MLDPLAPGSFSRPSDHGPDLRPAACQFCDARAEDECARCRANICREHRRHCIGECGRIFCRKCALGNVEMEYSVCGECPEHWAGYQEVLPLSVIYTRAVLHNPQLKGLGLLDWCGNYLDLEIYDTDHVPECRVAEIRKAVLKLLPERERRGFEQAA